MSKIIPVLLTFGGLLALAGRFGFDAKKLFDLSDFAADADFKVNRFYGFNVLGGIQGEAVFFIDVDVINTSDKSIIAENLFVKAYNEKGQYIGESAPHDHQAVIAPNSTTTVTGIEVHADFAKILFDYALPSLVQVISERTWENFSLGKTIILDVFVEMNGYNINKRVELPV